ncbi:EutP/PduV family microcompartment system protein [Fundicoccus culcitae]|uniref:EutP/PduV family microcompartment system protein n=1 Tax=Fundicoccus culcitae TaxID=2969821 RepID=A0ABY5P3S7_9LACT|nr:EutP/PduV family microcompartment system protein [Fundicoccus culcitae]UUX33319.1 EutP/PduV family microcompartment system protein [Fundicoccus culcitae]
MKKVMFIGPVFAGKTTLKQAIYGEDIAYDKTQAVDFFDDVIDTPGEFIQHRYYYSSIQNLSTEVDLIAFVSSATDTSQIFSPGFAHSLVKPCIGIITKVDISSTEEIKLVEDNLKQAGVTDIFKVSSLNRDGIDALLDFLNKEED